jgi:predicted hydrocarbon binding protein
MEKKQSLSPQRKIDNLLMNIYLRAIWDMVGEQGIDSILEYVHLKKYSDAFPPENDEREVPLTDLTYLYHSFFDLYAYKDPQNLQLRMGQTIMKYALETVPNMVRELRVSSSLLSQSKAMHVVLEKFVEESECRWPSPFPGPHTILQEENQWFLIIERDCFLSEDITSQTPVCFVYVGALEFLVQWVTGHHHTVEEIECRALGHPADVFKIWKSSKEKI